MTKSEKKKIFNIMNDYQKEFSKPDCQDDGITYKIEAVHKVICSLGIYGEMKAKEGEE